MATREIKLPLKWCEKKCANSNVLGSTNIDGLTWFSDTERNALIGIREIEPLVRVVIVSPHHKTKEAELYDYTFNPDTITKKTDGITCHWVRKFEKLSKRAEEYAEFVLFWSDYQRRIPLQDELRVLGDKISKLLLRQREIEFSFRENPEWIAVTKEMKELNDERNNISYNGGTKQLKFVQNFKEC